MSWNTGFQPKLEKEDVNTRLLRFDTEMTDQEARETLTEFLRHNLGFTFEMLTGGSVKLLEIQELLINALFDKDNSLVVAGRGFGKSFLIIVFCILYGIFNPGTKICIVANNFRAAKRIFDGIEKMVKNKKSFLLQHCFNTNPSRQPDSYTWRLPNGSEILALPLSNGEGLRGTRANVLIIDEALLISEEIQKSVLNPFLTARGDINEQMKVNAIEDDLIAAGVMKPEERTTLSTNKLILMSSASYQFEYLYTGLYLPWIGYILDPEQKKKSKEDEEAKVKPTYMVGRLSYEVVPDRTIMDETVIEAAKAGGGNNVHFLREYCARFVDVSGSYFNIRNLHECTHEDGNYPVVQLKGSPQKKYILSIDPSYSQSGNSDFFAMGVYMLDEENRTITQVHTYAKAGGELHEHHQYLTYILQNFNIVYAIIDGNGTEFTDGYNLSTVAKDKGTQLGYITNVNFENDLYEFEVRKARAQYNASARKFLFAQPENAPAIQRMNEYLQTAINSKKVWFASRIGSNEPAVKAALQFQLPYPVKDKHGKNFTMQDFVDDQDNLIKVTKEQVASVEVKAGVTGVLHFDLPAHLKKLTADNRPRKDNYTCLLHACYAAKHYFDITQIKVDEDENSLVPMFF